MDGQFHAIEFDPSATAEEVLKLVKAKIGLREQAQGMPYIAHGNRCIHDFEIKSSCVYNLPSEKILVSFFFYLFIYRLRNLRSIRDPGA